MKWDGDPYKELKWAIFDLMRYELSVDHAEKITISKLANEIDEMVNKLTSISND